MSRMPIRYVSQNELIALLRDSPDLLAERARASLDPTDMELVPVSSGTLDLRTYARSSACQDVEHPRQQRSQRRLWDATIRVWISRDPRGPADDWTLVRGSAPIEAAQSPRSRLVLVASASAGRM